MGEKKQNKILMLTYGGWNHASSRIRALYYIPELENSGWKIHWLPRAPEEKSGIRGLIIFALVKRFFTVKRYLAITFSQWDLIFVQRLILSPVELKILHWRNIPLIYDFDDAIYLGSIKNKTRTKRMIQAAKKVIVSNNGLAEFCKEFNSLPVVLPSPVDNERINKKNWDTDKSEVIIGWIGSTWTEKYVKEIEEALASLNRKKVKLLLVGASKNHKINRVRLEIAPWSFEMEKELLHRIDIGIMPLTDDEWSRGKGGYKIYQYMAAGLPVVASPVGINKKIVDHGINGFLANNKDEWIEYLSTLIQNPDLRKTMGERGRDKMVNNYSYKACFPVLNSALKNALNPDKS